jgi:hypothetical protein
MPDHGHPHRVHRKKRKTVDRSKLDRRKRIERKKKLEEIKLKELSQL